MSYGNQAKAAFSRLNDQRKKIGQLLAVRAFRSRSGLVARDVLHPNWQLVFWSAASLILIGFLFADDAAGHWKSTISKQTYYVFRAFTDLGKSEKLLIPAAIAVLALGLLNWDKLNKASIAVFCRFQMLGAFVFLAIAGSGLSNNLLKIMIGRARPRHFDDLGAVAFDPPGFSSGFQSFPSGHSATAGALAIILILLFPRLKWTWLFLAAWIAASRVIVGAHYPSDAVAGFAYGASFTWLLALWFARRRLLFRLRNGLIRLPRHNGLNFLKLYNALHMLR